MRGLRLGRKKHFAYFQEITKPTLVVYGAGDEYCWGSVPDCVAMLKECQPNFTYKIIPDADHAFSGHQEQLAKIMARWLAEKLLKM